MILTPAVAVFVETQAIRPLRSGTDPLPVHAIASNGDKQCGRGPFDEMVIEAQACGSGDYREHQTKYTYTTALLSAGPGSS